MTAFAAVDWLLNTIVPVVLLALASRYDEPAVELFLKTIVPPGSPVLG